MGPDLSSPQGDEMMLLHLLEMQGRGTPDHRRPWSKPGLGAACKYSYSSNYVCALHCLILPCQHCCWSAVSKVIGTLLIRQIQTQCHHPELYR